MISRIMLSLRYYSAKLGMLGKTLGMEDKKLAKSQGSIGVV
jgi:hypothetical protein